MSERKACDLGTSKKLIMSLEAAEGRATPTGPGNLSEVFADLELRFLSSLTEQELAAPDRLFMHLEQAWWFYEDQLSDHHQHLCVS